MISFLSSHLTDLQTEEEKREIYMFQDIRAFKYSSGYNTAARLKIKKKKTLCSSAKIKYSSLNLSGCIN